jgi:hypothetical protein
MPPKAPQDFSMVEVLMWVTAIGLGSKVDDFKENAIDGAMLVSLQDGDLQGDLGLSNLQCRKFHQSLDFSNSLVAGGGGGPDQSAEVAALQQENAKLKAEVADLQAIINTLQGDQTPAPPPAPAPKPAPAPAPKPSAGRPVVREGAKGAARGAMLGAIGGAIAGDAAKGAKMGAAMGGTRGAMGGLAARRRARRGAY